MSAATMPDGADISSRSAREREVTLRSVTVIGGAVIALTFLFGFGNVLDLALRLGVPRFIAPLVAPAVDLSVIGLLVGTRYLAVRGASPAQVRPARRMLAFASAVTLGLNVIDPLVSGQLGKAAFDAVGPLLLIGWVEVAPGLLQAIAGSGLPGTAVAQAAISVDDATPEGDDQQVGGAIDAIDDLANDGMASLADGTKFVEESAAGASSLTHLEENLIERARQVDARHWADHQRPISAETLRKRLRISAARSRMLVSIIRADQAKEQASLIEAGAH